MEYHVTQSRPDNAVRAFRDHLVESLENMIELQIDIRQGLTQPSEAKRVAGRIEQLTALVGVYKNLIID